MPIKRKIKTLVVEDDPVQAEILRDKLVALNDAVQVDIFKNGAELFLYLDQYFNKHTFYFIVLDYFLQTEENKDVLNGFEIIQLLHEKYPDISVVLHSAYENDDGNSFTKMKEDFISVKEYVKKSEHAYVIIQNIIHITYIEWELNKKKNRMWIAIILFGALSFLATLHFITDFYLR